ncbi:MAG TPA: hypothetical protein PKA63_11890 [Oligoflexia bacterium]|nr:hypothetical protein [Oligoflexia bacterium]HMP49355.1 hypothetical protein [Oligoflexia bacterium]
MPNVLWTAKEIEMLVALRQEGCSIMDIAENLGRSRDSVSQLIRRHGLSDPVKSSLCKSAVRLTDEQHAMFIRFIKKNSDKPLEQLSESWNASAAPLGWPRLSTSYIYHWIAKLGLPHSWSESFKSDWTKAKMKRLKDGIFIRRMEEFLVWHDEEQKRLQLKAEKVFSSSKKTPRHSCLCCKNEWPLSKDFYSGLPRSFFLANQRLQGFQRGFCRFCDKKFVKELAILRSHDRDVSHLIERRKYFRRMGFDLAFEELLVSKRNERDEMLGSGMLSSEECRSCVRCEELWPLTRDYFRQNRGLSDGTPTYRGLCYFCDKYYLREIDRRKRDGRLDSDLKLERSNYLRKFRRQNAQTYKSHQF